jgi:L-alanine-DL-glutamate epimerase-like enolase superfamily enzyme
MTIPKDVEHRIQRYKVIEHSIPIHMPFAISKESLFKAELLTIQITTETLVTGVGESSPFPSLTYDTLTTAREIAIELMEALVGYSPLQALAQIETLKSDTINRSMTGYVGVESALWDLHAKCSQKPLAKVFGNANLEKIRTDITLPLMEPDKVSEFSDFFGPFNFPVVKVKVGSHMGTDVACLEQLYQTPLGKKPLILDGNQAFSTPTAKKIVNLARSIGFDVLFFEQPVPEKDYTSLAQLADELPVPLCVDESVRTSQDLLELLARRIKPIVNIKIMKSGIAEALKIVDLASKAQCPLMIGGMFESEIAMTFSLHLACGIGVIRYFDLDTPYFFKDSLSKTHPWQKKDSNLFLPDGPGLGLDFPSSFTIK